MFDAIAPKFTHNLLRVYINGCIDREVFLNDAEATQLRNSLF